MPGGFCDSLERPSTWKVPALLEPNQMNATRTDPLAQPVERQAGVGACLPDLGPDMPSEGFGVTGHVRSITHSTLRVKFSPLSPERGM